ncbi:helix-turn-helix transcriptional regulator [Microbacterium halophytorum]|uniref:helix-turn-helix transcriptional regulator n=1 Tax=Microbacterium halophytorum TaxID=2067568 RepID=UPI000CFACD41|nr:winged helix-turn-helix transcriptional regulator [Microbacterium halophytorum]
MDSFRPACGPISSYSRVRILHHLQEHPGCAITELCDATGLHQNTVREHLKRLIDGGYVIAAPEHAGTHGRPRSLYTVVTGEPEASSMIARERVAAAARRGDLMRRVLHEPESKLGTEATHQLDALIEDLEDSGFEPHIDEIALEIDLSPCPHAAALPEHRPVLCQVHLSLMQSVLNEAGGPLSADSILEAKTPEECTVRLRRS